MNEIKVLDVVRRGNGREKHAEGAHKVAQGKRVVLRSRETDIGF
jgi:hypothetical protein